MAKKKFLEVWFFLRREVKAPQIRKTDQSSKSKIAHLVHVVHRDEVESPLTDWLREAFESSERSATKRAAKASR